MILGKPFRDHTAPDSPFRRTTLDDLFRRAVERRGDALAMIDPPNRARFTDGAPRRLTYAEADRVVSTIAARLTELGLKTDAIIALQLPNTIESVLTLLGVLRAGMIAAPLPLLWRQLDAVPALSRIGARALITSRRIGPVDYGELAMHIAAETFTIRFLCAFGEEQLDGFVALDDVFDAAAPADIHHERGGNPADHVAVVTFDIMAAGLVPIARSHAELVAGGIAVALEGRMGRDTHFLGALATSSFAGLSSIVVPWLFSGGTLSLHQAFDGAAFAAQCCERCDVAVLPGPLIFRLPEAGLVGGRRGPHTVVAVWRTPERFAGSPPWPERECPLIDVVAFGEIGVVANRRKGEGKPAAIMAGSTAAPRNLGDGLVLVHVARNAAGTIALTGAMVPQHAFPPGVERGGVPRLNIAEDGSVDTGYACRLDRAHGALTVNAPPAGLISVGGYRFVLKELQDLVATLAPGSTLAALPDGLAGHRLAGVATDRNALRRLLTERGANPLIVDAFRERRGDRASAA
ncbi:MAG: AMP-binding protein [Xanthobacteraceae bacterium]